MNIEFKKRDGFYLIIIGILILILLRVFAFNSGNHMNDHFDEKGRGEMGMGLDRNNSSNLSGNEYMFAEMMIPHHQQAVEMSEMALATSKNAKILDLAKRIKEAQSAEITQMQSWIGPNDSSHMMDEHMGHNMGGMMSDEEMAKLKSSTGATFDKLFLEGMIVHHEGAIQMVTMIDDTNNKEVNSFGLNVVKVQNAEIAEMKEILASF